jgi:alpha-1,6-mannosyltransferase
MRRRRCTSRRPLVHRSHVSYIPRVPGRRTRLYAWSALGLAGSLLVAVAAPRALADEVVGWWYHPSFPGSRTAGVHLVWVGMAAMSIAWLALWRERPGRRAAIAIAAVWLVPLAVAPPLFSRDVYSYLAQGTILHLGLNPYHEAPAVLGGLGRQHVLDAVSPFWRHTTAPYGPLFLELVSLIVGITGQHLIAGVLLVRALDLIGLALVAIYVPRVARSLGTDRGVAVWLAVACPLVMLSLIAAGHNDALMIGLLAAGVSVALRGNPLAGVALCALAATIKVPALVGAVFIAVAWARAERDRSAQIRLLAASGAIVVVVLGAVTVASGVGVGWLSTSLFSTPAKVRLAITPATAVGYTVAKLLGLVSIHVGARGLESAFGVVATVLSAAVGLWLLYRVRVPRLVAPLGACLLIAAAGGPAAWPWYFSWGLVLIAACALPQRSFAVALALVVSAFLVKPSGILVLPLGSAPAVLAAYVLIAAWAWHRYGRGGPGRGGHRRGGDGHAGGDAGAGDAAAAGDHAPGAADSGLARLTPASLVRS